MEIIRKLRGIFKTISLCLMIALLSIGSIVNPSYAVEIEYYQKILDRGYFNVGIPPYDTPPYYYYDKKTKKMEGIDIDIVRKFANNIGVEAVFDKDSDTYNGLLKRTGAGEFDLTIGKLSTFYKRMEDAHPHEYMTFRHALLANRRVISKIQGQIPNEKLTPVLTSSNIKIGFIEYWVGAVKYGRSVISPYPNFSIIIYG